jgi:Ca-activated chloride channel family protein
MKLTSQFTYDQIRFDNANDEHLVISLTAPTVESSQRPPLCIVLVADNSGSMTGEKLHYAKVSMGKLVDHLAPGDYCGLVVFSTDARVEYKAQRMTTDNKSTLKDKINRIGVEGGTNFAAGMMLGCEMANNLDMPASTIVRVIMFSDGQPERGIARTAPELQKLLTQKRERASVSMFGFGSDADHNLLGVLATEGQGNYAHVPNPDSALAAFGKELGGLLSSYADGIVLTVTPNGGHTIKEVISDLDVEEEIDGEIQIKVPSMLAEETQHIVLALTMAAQKAPGPRAVNAVAIKLAYSVLENGNTVRKTDETKAKVQFVKAGEEQKKPNKVVDEIVARAQLAKAQLKAEEAVQQGNYAQAQQAFGVVSNSLADRGHDHLGITASYLCDMYDDGAKYAASSASRNVMRTAMTRGGLRVSSLSDQDEAVLRSTGISLSNGSQATTSGSFTGGGTVVPAPAPVPVTPDPAPVPVDLSGLGGTVLPGMSSGSVVPNIGHTGTPIWTTGVSSGSRPMLTPQPILVPQITPVAPSVMASDVDNAIENLKKKASEKKTKKPAVKKTLSKSRISKW